MKSFKLVAKVKTGNSITAYDIVNENGQKVRVSRMHFHYLVGAGQIEGVTGTLYNNNVILKGNLSEVPVIKIELPDSEKMTVRAVAKSGRTTVGCYYEDREELIPREVFEQDALDGKLRNVEAQRYKGKVLFRGVANIPVINISEESTTEGVKESAGLVEVDSEDAPFAFDKGVEVNTGNIG